MAVAERALADQAGARASRGRLSGQRLMLLGLVLLALALRLWGIGFGLPRTYHPDEPAHVLQALAVARGLPGGLTFANPPLYKYLLLGEYAVTYLLGRSGSPQDFVARFRADPSLLYLEARATSALLGSLTVVAAYVLGARWRSQRTGLLAAGWTAVAYLLVRDAHFGVNDALVTLLVTLTLVACLKVLRGGTWRDDLLAGALAGLAFTAKYQGLVVLVPLGLAYLLARERRLGGLVLALASMLVASLLTFPSLVLEPGRVLADIYLHLYLPGQTGYPGLDPAGGYLYYLKVLVWGLGWPLLAAALGASLILPRDRGWLLIVSVPGLLFLVLGAERMYFARLLLPALPALIVLAAALLDTLATRVRMPWAALLVPTAAVLVGLPTLADSAQLDRLLTRADTRDQARDWIEARLPPGTALAVDAPPLGPPLPADGYNLVVPDGALDDLPLAEYEARGVEYVVTSSFVADSPDARAAFYVDLTRSADLVAQFRPGDAPPAFVYDQIYAPFNDLGALERPGPTVSVYRLRR